MRSIAALLILTACGGPSQPAEMELWARPSHRGEESVIVHRYERRIRIGRREDPIPLIAEWETLTDEEECLRIHHASLRRAGGPTSTSVNVQPPAEPVCRGEPQHQESLMIGLGFVSHAFFGDEEVTGVSIVLRGDGTSEAEDYFTD